MSTTAETPKGILDISNVPNSKEIREFTTRASETVRIKFERIRLMPGWNERIQFGDLDELADTIIAAGLQLPITVDFTKDGYAYISDGERRYKAIERIRERGIPYPEIEAFVNPKGTTNIQRKIQQIIRNSGKAFEPIEEAKVYTYLIEQGMSAADIARTTGRSKMHVSNRLRLAGISDDEKQAIVDKVVSPTAVVDMVKEGLTEGERIDKIKEAKEQGTKIKVNDVKDGADKGGSPSPFVPDKVIVDNPDAVFSDDNNSKADDDEIQSAGINTSPNKKLKSPTLVDTLTEIGLMLKGLDATVIATMQGEEAVKAKDIFKKISEKVQNAKLIATHL